MRLTLLIGLLCAVGCDSRNGTFLAVDGTAAQITFDRVEFFFGTVHDRADVVPATPGHPAGAEPARAGNDRVVIRQSVETDDQRLAASTQELDYYLPPGEPLNNDLNYVLAIAYSGDQPVGVAEAGGLTEHTDAAYLYDLTLVAWDPEKAERWGAPTADCVRWTRRRSDDAKETTYAVVRANDLDCDASIRQVADCDDLQYCDEAAGAQCPRATCVDPTSCDVGLCTSGVNGAPRTCKPTLCLPVSLCTNTSGGCDPADPLAVFLDCALDHSQAHIEAQVPVEPSTAALCTDPYVLTVPIGRPCVEPRIAFPVGGVTQGFVFAVGPSSTGCQITITPPTPATRLPDQIHLVISLPSPFVGQRSTVIIGINAATSVTVTCSPSTIQYPPPPPEGFGGCGAM